MRVGRRLIRTAVASAVAVRSSVVQVVLVLRCLRVEVTLGLLRQDHWVLTFVFFRHGVGGCLLCDDGDVWPG